MGHSEVALSDSLSTTNMACNNRACNAHQHGLGTWLMEELGASWTQRDALGRELNNTAMEREEATQLLVESRLRCADLAAQLDESHENYNNLVMGVVRSRLQAKAKIENLEETNQRLTRLLDIQTNEAKGLARALRRSRIELEEARQDGWHSKKHKRE